MVLDLLSLPMLFLISLIISYQDIRYGKVSNKWILLGFLWGVLIIIFFIIWSFAGPPISRFYYFNILEQPPDSPAPVFTIRPSYLVSCLVNGGIALVISFLMWRFKAWAAGDAKLFIVYSFLIPLKYYWKTYLPYFPSFVLLVNIFIPIFLYLLIRSFLYYIKFVYSWITKSQSVASAGQKNKSKEKKERLAAKKARWKSIENMGKMLLSIVTIFLILSFLAGPINQFTSINLSSLRIFVFASLIIFGGPLSKLFRRPLVFKIIVVILISALGYGFAAFPEMTWQNLYQTIKMMAVFMVILGLFKKTIDFYIQRTSLREIKVEKLEPKMFLAEESLARIKKDREYYNRYIDVIRPDGLTPEQVEAIKKWNSRKNGAKIETVNIYKPFPFVVWMFLGVIITLILKGSLFHLVLGNF